MAVKGQKFVTDFFDIYTIGRLDYDTSGLLLLTNDSGFVNPLMHSLYEIGIYMFLSNEYNFCTRT
ncbi:hypothetical protein DV713_08215 [Parageobacillus thermoglucosidasius]|nr:hypothetical protein DV713_08215 [Parageobacillus thermoglucosidasius]